MPSNDLQIQLARVEEVAELVIASEQDALDAIAALRGHLARWDELGQYEQAQVFAAARVYAEQLTAIEQRLTTGLSDTLAVLNSVASLMPAPRAGAMRSLAKQFESHATMARVIAAIVEDPMICGLAGAGRLDRSAQASSTECERPSGPENDPSGS
jgi:hypothetical protein